MTRRLVTALLAALTPATAAAQAPGADSAPVIHSVLLRRYDIYAPSEVSGSIPRLANGLHFTTRASVVRRELLFRPGERYDSAAVAETARNLRSLGIFRTVGIDTVTSDSGLIVRVTTGDGWSTRPITNLRITGSTWIPTVGIEELNFLGTATLVGVRYRIDPDRSTLSTTFRQPRLLAGRVGLTMQYSHLSDGDLGFAMINKPWFSLAGRSSWQVYGETRKETVLRFFEGSEDPGITLQRRYQLMGAAAAWALWGGTGGYLRAGLNGQVRRDDYAEASSVDTLGHTVTGAAGVFLQWRDARFLVSSGLEGFSREEDVDVRTTIGTGVQDTPKAFG